MQSSIQTNTEESLSLFEVCQLIQPFNKNVPTEHYVCGLVGEVEELDREWNKALDCFGLQHAKQDLKNKISEELADIVITTILYCHSTSILETLPCLRGKLNDAYRWKYRIVVANEAIIRHNAIGPIIALYRSAAKIAHAEHIFHRYNRYRGLPPEDEVLIILGAAAYMAGEIGVNLSKAVQAKVEKNQKRWEEGHYGKA